MSFWTSLKAWPPTSSTIAGVAMLIGICVAVIMHQLKVPEAIPLVAGAVTAILMPQNTAAKTAVMQLTKDMIVGTGGGVVVSGPVLVQDAAAVQQALSGAQGIAKSMVVIALAVMALSLTACTGTQQSAALASPEGQLFCAIELAGGGQMLVGVIDAEATKKLGAAAPVAVLATGAAASTVQAECAQAASNAGGSAGAPVSPPAAQVPNVAITVAVAK